MLILKLRLSNILYKYLYPIYKILYFYYKKNKDKTEIKLLQKIVKKGDIILDIGANIGFYSLILSELVGENGRVYCFEPETINFNKLKRNTYKSNNIDLFNFAVSDKDDKITVYKSKLLNVDHRTYFVDNYDTIEIIDCTTIDNWISKHNIKDINLIKIDIQGFEIIAFLGMHNLFSKKRDLIIFTEFWPYGLIKAGNTVIQFFDIVNKYKFNLYEIKDNRVAQIDSSFFYNIKNFSFENSYNLILSQADLNL